jgi:hypothetical protein
MEDIKLKVVAWIKSGMNYNDGVNLLIELTNKQSYSAMFMGREPSMKNKLPYEICKASQLADFTDWKVFIQKIKNASPSAATQFISPQEKKLAQHYSRSFDASKVELSVSIPNSPDEIDDSKNAESYPPVIQRVILETASLFQKRRALHLQMCQLPENNSTSVILLRADLFASIKSISERLKVLYDARQSFTEKNIIPDERVLFESVAVPENNLKSKVQKLDAISTLDVADLKKMKKNLQTLNSKDQSVLDFQSPNHKGQKMPLPNGPKRSKLETRISDRIKLIEEIEIQILHLLC